MSAFMKENCAHKCDSNAYTYFTVAMPQNRFQTGALDIKNKDGKLIRLHYFFSRRLNFLYIVIAKKNSLKECVFCKFGTQNTVPYYQKYRLLFGDFTHWDWT